MKTLLEIQQKLEQYNKSHGFALSWGMNTKLWSAVVTIGKVSYVALSADPDEALERLKVKLVDNSIIK